MIDAYDDGVVAAAREPLSDANDDAIAAASERELLSDAFDDVVIVTAAR